MLSSWSSLHFALVNRELVQRKQVENHFRSQEAQLQEAQSVAHLGSWTLNLPGGVVEWSRELWRVMGLEPRDIERTFDDFIHLVDPEDRGLFLKLKEQMNQGPLKTFSINTASSGVMDRLATVCLQVGPS